MVSLKGLCLQPNREPSFKDLVVPDKGKLEEVGFFARMNLLNPTSVWDVSGVLIRKYVKHSCWPHKENFCDEEMG